MTARWTTDSIPSLAGKTVIITSANSGIGLEAARVFAAKDAHVVFAVRDEKKGRDAAATVTGSTEVRPLDLADLRSVREFAEDWSGGSYAGPGNRRELAGPPVLVGRSDTAADPAIAARLWTASEELTGVRYPAAQLKGTS